MRQRDAVGERRIGQEGDADTLHRHDQRFSLPGSASTALQGQFPVPEDVVFQGSLPSK
jgi:hypothetical protein